MIIFKWLTRVLLVLMITLILIIRCEKEKPVAGTAFPATKVMSIIIDDSGVVWAGTEVGIISYWKGKWTAYGDNKGLPVGMVNDITLRKNTNSSEILLGGINGVSIATLNQNLITSAISYTSSSSALLDNEVVAVQMDAQGSGWFATPKGLSVLNGSKWYSETGWGDLVETPATSLGAKSDGWIFTGTKGRGVARFKYDQSIDGITGASYYNTDWTGLPSDTILSVYVDQNNKQWFGTPNGVAFHSEWETKIGWTVYSVTDGLVNNRVQSITGDNKGTIWFGTPVGISSFDGTNWKKYTTDDGLVNPCVNDIAIDPSGIVWFATNGGISTFNGTSWKNFIKE
jgi:ligand-binding sensor domain-containing protein